MENEDFYLKFEQQLTESHGFPSDYSFKFIIKNDLEKIAEIQKIFDDMEYSSSFKDSKNGSYVSLNIQAFMFDAPSVIEKYKAVAQIKDVIML